MTREKSHNEEEQAMNPDAWMVTFSDLVMLLLTFFVLLLTMSSMDSKKLNDIFIRMKGSAGVLELSGYKEITDLSSFVQRYTESENNFIIDQNLLNHLIPFEGLDAKTEEMIKSHSDLLEIKDDERGIVVSFQENILFESGNVALKKEALPVLDSIAGAINSCCNDIIIMGHADNVPVRSELYKSNWELSSYRGLAVLEYFVKQKGLQPFRFTVGGYGPSRPLHPNDSPENRALNRRVEIIFKHLQGV
jgi:chemotaxis protein MotB